MHLLNKSKHMQLHQIDEVFFNFKGSKLIKVKQAWAKLAEFSSPNLIFFILNVFTFGSFLLLSFFHQLNLSL